MNTIEPLPSKIWPDTFKVRDVAHSKNLADAMQVVSLEVKLMIRAFIAMRQAAISATDTGYTAYLESSLIHVRNLIEFMIDTPAPTKITFRDFIPEGQFASRTLPDLKSIRELINQNLVHMDWKRTVPGDSSSRPVGEVIESTVRTLANLFRRFIELLPTESNERQFIKRNTQASLEKLDRVPAKSCCRYQS